MPDMSATPERLTLHRPPGGWRPCLHKGRTLAPGLLLCGVVGMAAAFIEMRWGGPRVLYALLIGMAFHEFSSATRQRPGVDFGAQTLLRLGIGLLGTRIVLHDLAGLGWPVIALIGATVASTLGCVAGCARLAGMPWRVGLIAGGATAICGASAALAIAATLPRDRLNEHRTLTIVVCATTLSTLAMLSYPLLCTWLQLPPLLAGLVLGGSIHDVAQVAVAGYAMGTQAGDTAIVVKLVRVAMLSIVVLSISVCMRWHVVSRPAACPAAPPGPNGTSGAAPPLVPWFMQLFVLLALLQTLHWLPATAAHALADLSQVCLALSAAALGVAGYVRRRLTPRAPASDRDGSVAAD